MKSKYDSTCKACGYQIPAGDEIERSPSLKKFIHKACYDSEVGNASSAPSTQTAAASTVHTPTGKSCLSCPSYLKPKEVKDFFGVLTDFPMCAQFGKVLGRVDLVPAAHTFLADKIGANCPKHGELRPKKGPEYLQTLVTTPRPDIMAAGAPTDDQKKQVSSCLTCRNFITADKTEKTFGWPANLCGATGRLLLGGNDALRTEASRCDVRRPGASRNTTEGMNVMPIFIEAEAYDPDPVKAFLARDGAPIVDPQEYPSDEPVAKEDAEYGIRAWRHVYAIDGSGRYVRLPIFDINSFSPEEQVQIPQTGDPEHPEWYVDVNGLVYQMAVALWEIDMTPALIGQPGTGKTELARHLAWLMGLPFYRISMSEESETDDLIGTVEFVNNETRPRLGRLVSAWTKPAVTLLDEPNTAPDAVWQRIRPMTDNSKQVALDELNGAIYNRDPYSFIVLAYNPAHDARNVGTKVLAAADRDRLLGITVDLPPRDIEKAIIRRQCVEGDSFEISDKDLERLMDVAADIRALVDNGYPITWGIRPNIKVARLLKWFDPLTAYKMAVTNDLEPETAETLLTNVRTRFAL